MDYYSSRKFVREKCFIFGRSNLESATILAQSPPKNNHFFRDMQTRQFHPYACLWLFLLSTLPAVPLQLQCAGSGPGHLTYQV